MMKFNLIQNKKSQFFTGIAILLILLMFASFEIFSLVKEKNSITTRVSTMDNFLFSMEKNLERQVYISGFRILLVAENEIAVSGDYIDVDTFFSEAFFNGTVKGEANISLIQGVTYADVLDSINRNAAKINVRVNISNSIINVSQDDPWHVKFSLISDFVMEDKEGLARWDKRQVISAYIPITEFEDPLFVVNTGGRVSRKITKTFYEENYVTELGDVTNLKDHVNKGYYAENTYAPSFLKRLEGDLSSDPNGIESFVNIDELRIQDVPVMTKSCIDYIYFTEIDIHHSGVFGMQSWFRIDDTEPVRHHIKYQVSRILTP